MLGGRKQCEAPGDDDKVEPADEPFTLGPLPLPPLPDVMACGARILEVGITPNRGDTASLLGIAREVRAFFGNEIRPPETAPGEIVPFSAAPTRLR